MGKVQDIPLELAQKIIVEELDKNDHKTLRLLNKHTKSVVDPILFSHIQLFRFKTAQELVESLAKGEDGGCIAQSIKSLDFQWDVPATSSKECVAYEEAMKKFLAEALKKMVKLQSFKLIMNAVMGSQWLYPNIFSSLGTLTSLSTFEYCNDHDNEDRHTVIPFHHLRNLQHVKINSTLRNTEERLVKPLSLTLGNSPALTHVSVELEEFYDSEGEYPRLDTLFSNSPQDLPLRIVYLRLEGIVDSLSPSYIQHLRSLKSVDITFKLDSGDDEEEEEEEDPDAHPESEPSIWRTFLDSDKVGIKLEKVVVNGLTEDLLLYLASYSGLQDLELSFQEHPEAQDSETSERRSRILYDTVIPKHSMTLRVLKLPKTPEAYWHVGMQNVGQLQQCVNLQVVHLLLNHDDIGEPNSENDVLTKVLNIAVRMDKLEELEIGFPIIDDVQVALLLAVQWHENISSVRCKYRRQQRHPPASLCVRFAGQVFELREAEDKDENGDRYSVFVPTIPISGEEER
ncbi:hypothetical protein Moror_9592 [Moniliophthora roreri MCA 2997]|uniref:F-box domain-containing protein n=2 Tax=Moniliophthora roreri TaxID=221103 RepID=V2WW46_MONRO|nr:hypothetical protein Moror_9592 [Moniliophthora roreri MCA 2997]KAI3616935.1 hypothetical protein WG66_004237 [Moniliophthora roreri]